MTEPINGAGPDLFPVPPAVAWTYARAVEIALKKGDRFQAFAAIDLAFDAAGCVDQMPDETDIQDLLQSGSMTTKLKAKGIETLGELCRLSVKQLRRQFKISDQGIDRIQGTLEEIGRRLEG